MPLFKATVTYSVSEYTASPIAEAKPTVSSFPALIEAETSVEALKKLEQLELQRLTRGF